jgi:lysophospholipase L1-like esterase
VPGATSADFLQQLKNDLPPGTRRAIRDAQIITIFIGGNNLDRCVSNNFGTIDTACAAQGVADFERDWPLILQEIRTGIGSQAKLYVATQYNPYKGDDPNYATADPYIRGLAAPINDPANQSAYDYKVVDVYADFQGQLPEGTWKVCNWTHFCEDTRDQHPTQAGYEEIARLHAATYP